ncbi:hypothetical protein QJS04_geneDACA015635 [Acorus gramineus]|uniref:Uncharacterized protein n=1 Tax=Acorus gramineus TaxID=55184 RepID=A0AAV9AQV0_ACOGR|nr:hypothetical protein QJS04_geneDACA015635 [Acorus gramineus]
MAAITTLLGLPPPPPFPPISVSPPHLKPTTLPFRCSARVHDNDRAPRLLKAAVTGVTELLRLFSPSPNPNRGDSDSSGDEPFVEVSCVDEVLTAVRSDFERAYFVTGKFSRSIYAEDCSFEDPTIKFCGRDRYLQNLELLVPFFDCPSTVLTKIEKGVNLESEFLVATWKLRTYLKLPWRPLISIGGTTLYELNDNFKIVRHVESWDVSALEAIGQIFTTGSRKDDK